MADNISVISTSTAEIVLSERVVTSEYRVVEMHENVLGRTVRAEVELGPFITEQGPGPDTIRGSSRKSIIVWQGDDYDAVRDTWTNRDLLVKLPSLL